MTDMLKNARLMESPVKDGFVDDLDTDDLQLLFDMITQGKAFEAISIAYLAGCKAGKDFASTEEDIASMDSLLEQVAMA